jgi:transposase-like protein
MLKETRQKQVEKMIFAGMGNLFKSQDVLNLDQFSITVLESLMLLEREEYLKGKSGEGDIGNGTYPRTFSSLRTNCLQIQVPRSRNGKFKPVVLELLTQSQAEVNNLALLLYRKGLSSRDISSIMEEYFGENLSKDTISNLSESFHEIRQKWESEELDAYYKVVYADALFVSLKRGNSYSKEAVYLMYGLKDDNTRELLLLEVNPTEGSSVWGEYFAKLKARGVCQIDLIVADGLVGFSEAARRHFPEADFQKCVVHLQRSILSKVRPRDKEAFAHDLREIFNNFDNESSKVDALSKAKQFARSVQSTYPAISDKFANEEYLLEYLTYVDYPCGVRRMIYTTNSVENLNRQIRRVTKTKVTFDKESNMLDLIFMIIKDFESCNWQRYSVISFQS